MIEQEPEVFAVLRQIRYDLTAAQAKVTEALNMLAALNLPVVSGVSCPRCGVLLAGPNTLRSHLANVHGGDPVPLSEEEVAA